MTKLITALPQIRHHEEQENIQILTLWVAKELDYFRGHFPQAPILAGVVQLDWAVKLAAQYLSLQGIEVADVEVLKFQQVIKPDTLVTLTLEQKSPLKFTFSYKSASDNLASGRIVLAQAQQALA